MYRPEIEQKNRKKLSVLKIIAFESGTTNSHNPKLDIFHWQSMCYATPLGFNYSVREIFSKWASLGVMKNLIKAVWCKFCQSWGPFIMLTVKGVLERCFLESGLTTFLTFCNFRNKGEMAIIFFFKMFKI